MDATSAHQLELRENYTVGQGIRFPMYRASLLHRHTVRNLGSPGAMRPSVDKGKVVLTSLGGVNCPLCAACDDFRHFNARLAMYIIKMLPPMHVKPQVDGLGRYTPQDLTDLLCERVLDTEWKGGWQRPTIQELADRKKPSVQLFRILTLTNKKLPRCCLRLRAYPFKGSEFHGRQRQVSHCKVSVCTWACSSRHSDKLIQPVGNHRKVCRIHMPLFCLAQDYFSAIPDCFSREEFTAYHIEEGHTWVGQVIVFFVAHIREGVDRVVRRRLAFVKWLDAYAPNAQNKVGESKMVFSNNICHPPPSMAHVITVSSIFAASVIDKASGMGRLYVPKDPWYDVIDVERILTMQPLLPDFYNPEGIPKEAPNAWHPKGVKGGAIFVRNNLASHFGRCAPQWEPVQQSSN